MRSLYNTILLLSLVIVSGCGGGQEPAARDDQLGREAAGQQPVEQDRSAGAFLPDEGPSEKDYPELHNLMQVTGSVYSGAEPKSEAAFAQLAELGVKVIVSVDGAKPKVDLAKKYGLRYVHIPIGYDGIDDQAARSFARAADELNEPTYVHCHHGKHRGPAGAAAICVARGDADGERALQILEKAGTSKGYAGLWWDVKGYQRPAADEELPKLVEVAEVGSMAAAMAQIDRASDNLKLCEAAQWQTPADHPDVAPPQEALLLKEGFHETARQLAENNDYDEQFLAWIKMSEQSALRLETALNDGDKQAAAAAFAEVQSQCKRCHAEYRD